LIYVTIMFLIFIYVDMNKTSVPEFKFYGENEVFFGFYLLYLFKKTRYTYAVQVLP